MNKRTIGSFHFNNLAELMVLWKNSHFIGWFFDFVIILRPITMYQDYLNSLWPLSVRSQGKEPCRRRDLPGGSEASRAPGQNLISSTCPSPVPSPPVLAHLHSESAATILPTTLSSQEHKMPFPSPVTN